MSTMSSHPRPLRRILGLGFGLAMAFGATVGVGILRLPGTLASALGDSRLIVMFWIIGGLYAVLGAVAVAELSTMMPQAGGFYVYTKRAFGRGAGFVVGWTDWANNVASIAYAAMTATTFLAGLWPPAAMHAKYVAVVILAIFSGLHWVGLRFSSTLTGFISVTVGLMLLILIVACFVVTPAPHAPAPPLGATAASLPLLSLAMLSAVTTAMRSVLVTYDGWYSPIYFAEENTDPAATLPRSIVGGTLLIGALYIVLNIAILNVLPLPVLAAAELPAAEAARAVLPSGGAQLVTLISLLTVLSLVNATLLTTPRILLAIGRDGLFTRHAASVSAGGTPRTALALTSVTAMALVSTGTFEQIVALAAVLFLLNYLSAYASMFVLRRREPNALRPYRAFGFPITTAIVLLGSVLFLVAAIGDDRRSGVIALCFVLAVGAVYWAISAIKVGSQRRPEDPN
jgi:APA family basic amino acid/polyamine antiporter